MSESLAAVDAGVARGRSGSVISRNPNASVALGSGAGVGPLIVWSVGLTGTQMPPEVGAAFGGCLPQQFCSSDVAGSGARSLGFGEVGRAKSFPRSAEVAEAVTNAATRGIEVPARTRIGVTFRGLAQANAVRRAGLGRSEARKPGVQFP